MLPERPVSLVVMWQAMESDELSLPPAHNMRLPVIPARASHSTTMQTQYRTQRYGPQFSLYGTDLILPHEKTRNSIQHQFSSWSQSPGRGHSTTNRTSNLQPIRITSTHSHVQVRTPTSSGHFPQCCISLAWNEMREKKKDNNYLTCLCYTVSNNWGASR